MVQPVDSPPMAMERVSLPVTVVDLAGWLSGVDWGNALVTAKRRRERKRRDLVFMVREL